jgi:hypothetical protein
MSTLAQCPACSDPVAESARFCPRCGVSLDTSHTPTGTAPAARGRATPPAGTRRPSSSGHAPTPGGRATAPTIDGGRFLPGTLLLDRYRVIELLGRGGMGEVYRAEDLVLGQSVALKFLPGALREDPERLARFYNEARMAREVTHPAVCRVHDVAEADGHIFLSMEYVDGEDLASLLRRIGRLPRDKAVEIARQLCAAVAAAHDKGVLHRDLKPQNVMLDGRGNVRVTDFGLAGLAGSIHGDEVRSGTPGYMSPEQLAGREVTARSDIYAIGLILYELFTGQRAYPGRGLAEVRQQHDEPLRAPSSLVEDLDPALDAAVMRCVEENPAQRPVSARAVSALLPGGDALAAALRAGEIPTPEMVAAAGRHEGFRPATGWACVAAVGVFLVATLLLHPRLQLLPRLPDARPAVVLEDRAREFLRRIGYGAVPADRARGIGFDDGYFRWAGAKDRSPRRWEKLRTGEPPVLSFWYRQGPRPLIPTDDSSVVEWSNPPWQVSDMAGLRLDFSGRLVEFYAVPPQVDATTAAATEPDWGPLFSEAGLEPAHFASVAPTWTPPFYCDRRQAWEGTYPRRPEIPLRVEAAAYRGRPVFFRLVEPWSVAERMQASTRTAAERTRDVITTVLMFLLFAVGGWLAWRNLKLGRGDRRGAARLGAAVFVMGVAVWALGGHHVADRDGFMTLMARETGATLRLAFVLWVFYLALEPYVRRFWPRTIISWTRLLTRGPRDPLIARDVLFGMVWAGAVAVLILSTQVLSAKWGQPEPIPGADNLRLALGLRYTASAVLSLWFNALVLAMSSLLLLLFLKLLLRSERLASWLLVAILTFVQALPFAVGERSPWLAGALAFAIMAPYALLLRQVGVVACIAAVVTTNLLLSFPLTLDLEAWHAGTTIIVTACIAALAAYALHTSVYGRPVTTH